MVLAVVGGLSAIVWPTLNMILGGYETFKFKNSLIETGTLALFRVKKKSINMMIYLLEEMNIG